MITLPELVFSEKIYCENLKDRRKISGIYRIYNQNNECMYIGKGANIFQRIREHLRKTAKNDYIFSHNYIFFDYVIIDDEVDREIYETYYINLYKPICNKQKVFYTIENRELYYNPDYVKELEKEAESFRKSMEDFFLL